MLTKTERQRESEAKLASNEALERERMAFQNSKEIRVKRASGLLHKSIQPISMKAEDVPSLFVTFETQSTLNGVQC